MYHHPEEWQYRFMEKLALVESCSLKCYNLNSMDPIIQLGEQDSECADIICHKLKCSNLHKLKNLYSGENTLKLEDIFIGIYTSEIMLNMMIMSSLLDTPYVHLIYNFKGKPIAHLSDRRVEIPEGHLCIIDSNTPHFLSDDGEHSLAINIFITKRRIRDLINTFITRTPFDFRLFASTIDSEGVYIMDMSGDKVILNLLCEAMYEHTFQPPYYEDTINNYASLIFTAVLREYWKISAEFSHQRTSRDTLIVAEVLAYVNKNLDSANLKDVAEHFHYSPNYLGKLISNVTGYKFTDCVKKARAKKALFLLRNSDLSVSEIGNLVGYKNISYFYKIFKDIYGDLPSTFR